MTKGAMAPPIEEPLSNSALAKARSCLGNHSDTALVAPGQLADSPAPSRNRKAAKLRKPVASEVAIEINEYHKTEMLSPRRVPTRSMNLPHAVWPTAYAMRKLISRFA